MGTRAYPTVSPAAAAASRLAAAALAVLTGACSAVVPQPGPAPPGPIPSTTASVPGNGRPAHSAPQVRPPGFTDAPPGKGLARYGRQRPDWRPCGSELQCATVLVPLDYARPNGSAITLALARRPASEDATLGTLFLNPGGPGVSGVQYVEGFDPAGLEGYDIVGWDPRGVAASTPVRCGGSDIIEQLTAMDGSPDDAAERSRLIQASREFGLSCLKESGQLLRHVSTAETARDLDLLRQIVGEKKLRYFGSSYGTRIGATYAELFPEAVGRVVLDGAVNITGKRTVSQAEGFDNALHAFAAWCADRDCSLGSSEAAVTESVVALWNGLDREPIRVGRRELTQQLAVTGVVWLLYQNEQAWRYLAQALELAIDDGDGRALLAFADAYNQRDQNGEYGQSNAAFPSIACLDAEEESLSEADAEFGRVVKQAPTVGPFVGPNYMCPLWPVPPAPDPGRLTGDGAAPILVIGTTGDPATPYQNAVGMARQLQSGVLVTLEGSGHLAYGQSPCVRRIVQAYLVGGVLPEDGTRC